MPHPSAALPFSRWSHHNERPPVEQHLGYKRSDLKSAPAQNPPPAAAAAAVEKAPRVEKVARGRRRLVEVPKDYLPSEVDWVEQGAVTPVQNQVQYGTEPNRFAVLCQLLLRCG